MAESTIDLVEREPLLQPADLIPDQTITSAKEDAFSHHSLAGVVADVVRAAGARGHKGALNIGLFGAWGAGKSSFFELLQAELQTEVCAGALELVRYDAWKYQGAALERHFIEQVALDLGVDPPDLYATKERKRFDPRSLDWGQLKRLLWWMFSWALPLLILAVAVYAVVSGLVALVSHATFSTEMSKVPKYILAPATLLALAAAAARIVFADVWVTERRERPADEELGKLFKSVLEAANQQLLPAAGSWVRVKRRLSLARPRARHLANPPERRFVFFIDELDRCNRSEVVETLSAIKNFLGQPSCVFIVAADRDVLEEAFENLQQANPANDEAPYYSSASEFLDKIFQTQIAFPPLREQRRTRYARDLVLEKKRGLWAELREADEGRALDDVIYVLIPGHVQSPRRIKVLLNNFAVNARRCQARELPWLTRATEIAKLTVFETEFPSLARDLAAEPRLPQLLLDEARSDELSPRTKDLLRKHALPRSDDALSEEADESGGAPETTGESESPVPAKRPTPTTETDKLLVRREEDRKRLARVQRAQLRRYLESRRDFDNPRRDLLYLENIGAAVDLDDPDLADLLETEGPEQPQKVVDAVAARDQETIEKAVRILASLVPQNFGREQQYATQSLMGCVGLLKLRTPTVDAAVAYALWVFLEARQKLGEDDLVLALDVALGAGRTALVEAILADERTLEDTERVREVASRLDGLPPDAWARVESKVVEFFELDQDGLFRPLAELPEAEATRLLENTFESTIARFISTASSEEAEQTAVKLYEAVGIPSDGNTDTRSGLAATAQRLLLSSRNADAYLAVRDFAPVVLAYPENHSSAARDALQAFAQAPSGDWEEWVSLAEKYGPGGRHLLSPLSAAAIGHIFDTFAAASVEEQEEAAGLLERILGLAPIEGEADAATVGDALDRAIASAWETDPDATDIRERLHNTAWALRDDAELGERITDALGADLERAARTPGPNVSKQVARVAVLAPSETIVVVAELLKASPNADRRFLLRALLSLARKIAERGDVDLSSVEVFSFDVSEVAEEALDGQVAALRNWLMTNPPLEEVIAAAVQFRTQPNEYLDKIVEIFAGWAGRKTLEDRTSLLLPLLSLDSPAEPWIRALRELDLDEAAIVERLGDLEKKSANRDERKSLALDLCALAPRKPVAQRQVADFAVALLRRNTAADFESALKVILAAGVGSQRKSRLKKELRRSSDSTGNKVPANYEEGLAAAGIDLPKKYFKKKKSRWNPFD